jgi:uncharacterized repeat protein (TIGR01451 family)
MSIRGLQNESPSRGLPQTRRGRRIGKKKAPYRLDIDQLEKRELPAIHLSYLPAVPGNQVAGTTFGFKVEISADSAEVSGATLVEHLSSNLSFISANTIAPNIDNFNLVAGAGQDITFTTGAMGASHVDDFTFVVSIAPSLADGGPAQVTISTNATAVSAGSVSTAALGPSVLNVNALADLAITKTGPGTGVTFTAGNAQPFTFTLSVANNGPSDAVNVTLTDVLDTQGQGDIGVSLALTLTPGGWGSFTNGTTVTFTLDPATPLVSGSPAQFEIVATIPASATVDLGPNLATVVDTATATAGTPLSSAATPQQTAVVVQLQTDLSVTKTGPATTVVAGSSTPVTFTLSVSDFGPSNVLGPVLLFDTLPAGTEFFNGVAQPLPGANVLGAGPIAPGSNVIEFTLAPVGNTLAVGAGHSIALMYGVTVSPTALGAMTNTASVTSRTDPSGSISSWSLTTAVAQTDLQITKTILPGASLQRGTLLTYDVTVTNNGPSAESDTITVSDSLAPAATFFGPLQDPGNFGWAPDGSGDFTLAPMTPIPSLGTVSFEVVASIGPGVTGGTVFTNQVTVSSADDTTTLSFSAPATVVATADLGITISTTPASPVVAGATLTYDVQVTNTDLIDSVTGITLTDTLDGNTTFLNIIPGSNWSVVGVPGNLVTFVDTFDTIAPSGTLDLTFDVSVAAAAPAGSNVVDRVTIAAAGAVDSNTANNASTVSTAVTAVPDLAITKAAPGSAVAGNDYTYTLVIKNNGLSEETATISITDSLDSALTLEGDTILGGPFAGTSWAFSSVGSVVTFNSPTGLSLDPGQSTTLAIGVSLSPTAATTHSIQNFGTVSSVDDPTPSISNTVTTTVNNEVTLDVAKTGPGIVDRGTVIVYTIVVTNNGPSAESGEITVTDTFDVNAVYDPTGFGSTGLEATFGSAWGDAGPIPFTTKEVFTLIPAAPLLKGDSATFAVAATVSNFSFGTSIDNHVTVTGLNDQVTHGTAFPSALAPAADLSVTINNTPSAPITAGTTLTYDYRVTSTAQSDPVKGITLTETLDANTSFLAEIPSNWVSLSSVGGSIFTFFDTTDTLTPAASLDLSLAVVLDQFAAARAPTFTTEVTIAGSAKPDPNLSNNTAALTLPDQAQTDLQITKTVVPGSSLQRSDLVTYEITVSNTGPSGETAAITVSDAFDTAATVTGQVINQGSAWGFDGTNFTLGSVSLGVSTAATPHAVSFEIVASIGASVAGGTVFTNHATVSSIDDTTTLSASAPATVVPTADLGVTILSANPDPAVAGAPLTYDIQVTNTDQIDSVTGITLTETLDGNTSFVANLSPATWSLASSLGNVYTFVDTTPLTTLGTVDLSLAVSVASTAASIVPGLVDSVTIAGAGAIDSNTANNASTITTACIAETDLSITKQGPANAFASETNAPSLVTYTITVKNNGPSEEEATISVSDTFDASLSYAVGSATALGGGSVTPGTPWTESSVAGSGIEVWTAPAGLSLDPFASTSFTVVATVSPVVTLGMTITNVVGVTSNDDLTNRTGQTQLTILASADLSITKSGPTTPISAGNPLTYTLTVTNNSPDAAINVTVFDTLDGNALAGATLVQPTGWTETILSATLVQFTNPSLAAGESDGISLGAFIRADETVAGTAIDNATVFSSTPDHNTINNASSTATVFTLDADLVVTKNGPTSVIAAGTTAAYTITVTDFGPTDAQNVTVVDHLDPLGGTTVSLVAGGTSIFGANSWNTVASATDVTFVLSPSQLLTTGSANTATFVVVTSISAAATVDLLSNQGTIVDVATVTAATPLDAGSTTQTACITTIQDQSDLSVTKSGPASALAGTTVLYTIVVANNGPSDVPVGNEVFVTDTLDPHQIFLGASSSDSKFVGPVQLSSSLIEFIDGSGFTVGDSVTLTVTIGLPSPLLVPSVTDVAQVAVEFPGSVNSVDPNQSNNSFPATTAIGQEADLVVKKTGPTTPVHAGDEATYTITVFDAGPSDALNVTVTDLLDTLNTGEVSFVGWSELSGTGQYTTLPFSGQSVSFVATSPTVGLTGNAGETLTFAVVTSIAPSATVGGGGTATLQDIASALTSTTVNPASLAQASSTYTTTIDQLADLSVSEGIVGSASPPANADGVAGELYTVTFSVQNNGPSDAHTVSLTESIPGLAGISLGSSSYLPLVSLRQTSGTDIWSIPSASSVTTLTSFNLTAGTVASGKTDVFTIVESIAPSVNDYGPNGPAGLKTDSHMDTPVIYSATVGSATPDTDLENNSTGSVPGEIGSVSHFLLTITATSDVASQPSTVFLLGDRLVNVSVTMSNVGPSDARNIQLVVQNTTPGVETDFTSIPIFLGSQVIPGFPNSTLEIPTSGVINGLIFSNFVVESQGLSAGGLTVPTVYPANRSDTLNFQVIIASPILDTDTNPVVTFRATVQQATVKYLVVSTLGSATVTDSGSTSNLSIARASTLEINPGKPPLIVVTTPVVVQPQVQVVTAIPVPIVNLVASPAPVPSTIETPLVLQQLSRSIQSGEIVGQVFSDENGNGIWDNEETPLEGITVYLDLDGTGVYDESKPHTTTNARGEFRFENLAAGTYPVRVVLGRRDQLTLPDPADPNGSGGAHKVVVTGAVTVAERTKTVQFGIRKRRARTTPGNTDNRSPETPETNPPVAIPASTEPVSPTSYFAPPRPEEDAGRAAVFERFDELIAPGRGWVSFGELPTAMPHDLPMYAGPNHTGSAPHEGDDGWMTKIALVGMLASALVAVNDRGATPGGERPYSLASPVDDNG